MTATVAVGCHHGSVDDEGSVMIGAHPRTAESGGTGGRTRQRLVRGLREFAAVPLLVVAGFLLLSVASIVADQTHTPGVDRFRALIGQVIGRDSATTALQAVATGLVTVTSITFSVLLLAVQQTAASLSPVVFDQFVRRRSNQALLGFFVGLTLYAYVVVTAVPDDTAPIIGAALATGLTVCALIGLLALVYTTIDQMRPVNVLRQIRERTLLARRRELPLLVRTRRAGTSPHPVVATYRSPVTGFVTRIDLDRLERALRQVPRAEIMLHVTLGGHLAFGDVVATVHDDDRDDAERVAHEVRSAVVVGATPDLDGDATTGIDQLANIAWTSGSTAKHNPETARQAIHALQDVAARWLADGTPSTDGPTLAVIYPDGDLDRVLDVFYSLLVVSHESQQHMTAVRVLDAYGSLLGQADGRLRGRVRADLATAAPLLNRIPASPALRRARHRLAVALDQDGPDAG
ncbi:DUF2254 family protein [Micromonospora sp. WMMD998]|uniref:DUF2254 family protein n=1 Tax=Micromonospora sp. WMMD998 TaxID=3016092 RepID=UPI00249C5D97|nr:DUF2254 family protein [Micromonospora sp. WMMD998]WFE39834.1 DUF2254 family protein [Micromonospora sp. WMMD998]